MSNDFDDNWTPGAQLNPLKGYEELGDVLDPVTGRMIGRLGVLGMTIEEATRHTVVWWDKKGRRAMPDYNKSNDYLNDYGMKSGILLGLPWAKLNRGERIRVVKIWHHEIGIFRHGMGISSDKDLNNALKIEEQNKIRQFDLEKIFGSPAGTTHH